MTDIKRELAALNRAAADLNAPTDADVERGMHVARPLGAMSFRAQVHADAERRARERAARRAANQNPRVPRWYVRCSDCLSIAAVDAAESPNVAACACGGKIEAMGKVTRFGRLHVSTREETPCDDRCTGAQGPKCDCPCGGENHGSGRVVKIDVTTGVPHIVMLDPEQAAARATEYRAALADARAAVDRRHAAGRLAGEAKLAGAWISADDYGAMREYDYALSNLRKAKQLRTHKGRLARLRAIAGGKDY